MTNINFSAKFKYANILSLALFSISIIFLTFKGLNYGIDFKGGTLIELRSNNTEASSIRDVLKNIKIILNKKKIREKIFAYLNFDEKFILVIIFLSLYFFYLKLSMKSDA